MTARRWWLGWVLVALVCAQALGFMHRVVHPVGGLAQAQVQALDEAEPQGIAALFSHDAPACRLLDALGHCGMPAAPALPLLPVLSAGLGLPAAPAGFIDSWLAPFQARGPPSSR